MMMIFYDNCFNGLISFASGLLSVLHFVLVQLQTKKSKQLVLGFLIWYRIFISTKTLKPLVHKWYSEYSCNLSTNVKELKANHNAMQWVR